MVACTTAAMMLMYIESAGTKLLLEKLRYLRWLNMCDAVGVGAVAFRSNIDGVDPLVLVNEWQRTGWVQNSINWHDIEGWSRSVTDIILVGEGEVLLTWYWGLKGMCHWHDIEEWRGSVTDDIKVVKGKFYWNNIEGWGKIIEQERMKEAIGKLDRKRGIEIWRIGLLQWREAVLFWMHWIMAGSVCWD